MRIASCRHRRFRAFTLIELLVAISIIVLLVAILLPALSAAREMARTTQCRSNMRQQGLVIHMYANDFRDMGPPTGICEITPPATFHGWVARLTHWEGRASSLGPAAAKEDYFYRGPGQLYTCPSFNASIANLYAKNYQGNRFVLGAWRVAPDGGYGWHPILNLPSHLPLGNVRSSSRTYLTIEAWYSGGVARIWSHNFDNRKSFTDISTEVFPDNHPIGGRGFLFVDGHVESHDTDPAEAFTPLEEPPYTDQW
jgi:prepilin-type N-terminal cleavage/methylation domain-containing protein/prepilin-type processing-associated H-X9-DG protein